MEPEIPWLERSPNFPAEASCRLIVHITRWKDDWVPCRDPRKSPRLPLPFKNGSNMPLTNRKPHGGHCFKFWRCLTIFFNIVRNPDITVSNRKRDLKSHLTSRTLCIFLPRLVYIPELSLIPRQVPHFNEQTRVSNGHPRCNSRLYPRFLPQLEKTHETFPSLRDEARFPCNVSRAIAFSQSNR